LSNQLPKPSEASQSAKLFCIGHAVAMLKLLNIHRQTMGLLRYFTYTVDKIT